MRGKFNGAQLDAGPGVDAFSTQFPNLLPDLHGVKLIVPQQTHTANVAIVDEFDGPFSTTDGLITQRTDIAIGIRTADCVPVLLNAPDIRAVAAMHAGWKGTIAGIAEAAVNALVRLGADPKNIYAAMGPCICADCYEVSSDLAATFADAGFAESISGDPDNPHLDLPDVNLRILRSCGLLPGNIRLPIACTKEVADSYPSWRRNPGTTDRLITVIRLTK